MKVAIYSESPADEAALRVLVDAVLGGPSEPVDLPRLRSRGWPSVKQTLPKVLLHLHHQTVAQGLVVVVDSDMSPLPPVPTQEPGNRDDSSRLGQLREVVELGQSRLPPRPAHADPRLRVALGMAVPAIEAWLRCGLDPHVSEANWRHALQSGQYPYDRKRLKRDVYGTDRASLELQTRVAIQEAKRVVSQQKLVLLEQLFPIGFGALAAALRSWQT